MTSVEKRNTEAHRLLLKATLLLSDGKAVSGQDINKIFEQLQNWVSEGLDDVSKDTLLFDASTVSVSSSEGGQARSLPSWRYFHACVLLLETLKMLSTTITLVETSSKKLPKGGARPSKEAVQALKEVVNTLQDAIRSKTRTLRSSVIGSGVLGAMTDLIFEQTQSENSHAEDKNTLAIELEKTLDASAVEVFCGELIESWEEALGGILSIK